MNLLERFGFSDGGGCRSGDSASCDGGDSGSSKREAPLLSSFSLSLRFRFPLVNLDEITKRPQRQRGQ